MITREDIEKALLWIPPTLSGKEIRRLFGELMKERDESLAKAREWKEKAEAYREVAKKWLWLHRDISRARMKNDYSEEVDAEMERIRGKERT